ncbi:hypothetical protein ACQPYK_34285 [Streptosporangium sp. CA-135522]|uniref:hypothetical protein n=1 Tax=Streptosporangium sp. CA-135522 TaxID=3240072 RepID=UPI003D8C625D
MTSGQNHPQHPQQLPQYPQYPQQLPQYSQYPQQLPQYQQQPQQVPQYQQQPPPQQPLPQQPPQPPPPRRRTGLWVALGVAAVVLTVGGGAVVGLMLKSDEQTGPSAAETAAADPQTVIVTEKALKALLEEETKALNSGDVKAYTKIFDQKNTTLVRQQARTFENLRKLPLTRMSYQTRQQQGRAQDSFGRGVTFTLDVAFVHQFKGIDLAPVSEWYRWTVNKAAANAPIVVTKVAGAPAPYGESKTIYYPGPWDIWPDISAVTTKHTVVLSHPDLAGQAARFAPVAERAAVNDLTFWKNSGGRSDAIPDGFVVALVKGQSQLGNLFRKSKANEAGVSIPIPAVPSLTEPMPKDVTIGGTRVVMDTTSAFFQTTEGTAEIFRHEFAHSTVASLDENKANLFGLDNWLVEGFAEYVANRGRPISTNVRYEQGRAYIEGRYPQRFEGTLPDNLHWDGSMRSFNYLLGHLANRYIAEKYGERKLVEFVAAAYAAGKTEGPMHEVLGVDMAQFQRQWAGYVRQQLG